MNAPKRSAGQAILEFVMVATLLMAMSYPVFDYFRAIQTYLILVNVSREGANLAARTIYTSPQDIMNALAATAPPLVMRDDGMVYITKVMGQRKNSSLVNNVVLEQYRWQQGWSHSSYAPPTTIWNCGANGTHWAGDGSCSSIPSNNRPLANLQIALADGEVVYAVDVFYRMPSLFGFGSDLMNLQVFPDVFQARTIM